MSGRATGKEQLSSLHYIASHGPGSGYFLMARKFKVDSHTDYDKVF